MDWQSKIDYNANEKKGINSINYMKLNTLEIII